MSRRNQWKKEGEEAFHPGIPPEELNPYEKDSPKGDAYDCWLEGWNKANAQWRYEQRRQEIVACEWIDPEDDPAAAIKQIQDYLDEQARGA